MKEGSLTDAIGMIQLDDMYHLMMTMCVHDVHRHLERTSGVFRGHCEANECIVERIGFDN